MDAVNFLEDGGTEYGLAFDTGKAEVVVEEAFAEDHCAVDGRPGPGGCAARVASLFGGGVGGWSDVP